MTEHIFKRISDPLRSLSARKGYFFDGCSPCGSPFPASPWKVFQATTTLSRNATHIFATSSFFQIHQGTSTSIILAQRRHLKLITSVLHTQLSLFFGVLRVQTVVNKIQGSDLGHWCGSGFSSLPFDKSFAMGGLDCINQKSCIQEIYVEADRRYLLPSKPVLSAANDTELMVGMPDNILVAMGEQCAATFSRPQNRQKRKRTSGSSVHHFDPPRPAAIHKDIAISSIRTLVTNYTGLSTEKIDVRCVTSSVRMAANFLQECVKYSICEDRIAIRTRTAAEVSSASIRRMSDNAMEEQQNAGEDNGTLGNPRTHVFKDIKGGKHAHQVIVSTNNDLLNAEGIEAGESAKQWFGGMSDASLQHLSTNQGSSSVVQQKGKDISNGAKAGTELFPGQGRKLT
jgi:hypothetical protein